MPIKVDHFTARGKTPPAFTNNCLWQFHFYHDISGVFLSRCGKTSRGKSGSRARGGVSIITTPVLISIVARAVISEREGTNTFLMLNLIKLQRMELHLRRQPRPALIVRKSEWYNKVNKKMFLIIIRYAEFMYLIGIRYTTSTATHAQQRWTKINLAPTGQKPCSERQKNVIFRKRFVNVKSLRQINVSFGRNADFPFSSLLVWNVQKTCKCKSYLNVKSQRPLDVYLLTRRIMEVGWTIC